MISPVLLTALILAFLALHAWTLIILYSNRKGIKLIMAAIDDLKAADAAETAELAVVAQALTDEVARVDALIAAIPPSPTEADIASVTADLQAHLANLQTIATGLASVAPAPPATT